MPESLEDVFQEITNEVGAVRQDHFHKSNVSIIDALLPRNGHPYSVRLVYVLNKDRKDRYTEELTVIFTHMSGIGEEQIGEIGFTQGLHNGITVYAEFSGRQLFEERCEKNDVKGIIYRALNMKPKPKQVFH